LIHKEDRRDGVDADDTARILRRARRLRIASIAAAMATVGVFGLLLAPAIQNEFGIRTTQVFETLIVGAALVLVTGPLSQILRRSVLELHDVREAWRLEAIRDFVTGLFNRRHFDGRLNEEVARTHRHGNPLSVIVTDVDHFKKVNDRHGHQAGDAALRELASRIKRMFRREDVVARMGGDEMAILMPDTPMDESIGKAERLRERIASEPIRVDDASAPVNVTISCGVASSEGHDDTSDDLMRRADESLYEAKKVRNAVGAVQADDARRVSGK
jgi:diguanylate cyclase (GGDEF)-like protein